MATLIFTWKKPPNSGKKGECFGYFEMGSTIVAIFEKDSVKVKNIKNQSVKFGDNIASII